MIGNRSTHDAEAFANGFVGRGTLDTEVQELVCFAEGLCELGVEPDPEFMSSLRSNLMVEADSVLVKSAPRAAVAITATSHPARRRLIAAATAVVAMAASVSLVASSAQALPGDMLYPIKRGVENVELTLHHGDAARGNFELAQATERLAEAQALSGRADDASKQQVANSLSAFTAKAESGSQSLFADYSDGGDRASVEKVNTFAASSSSTLAAMSEELPATQSVDLLAAAASAISNLATQAASLCADCDAGSLSSITKRITDLASPVAKPSPSTAKTKPTTTSQQPAAPAASPQPSGTVANTPPKTAVPLPSAPPIVAPLTDTTKTLLGTIVGDDEQPGLVTGLLGGLLGTPKN